MDYQCVSVISSNIPDAHGESVNVKEGELPQVQRKSPYRNLRLLPQFAFRSAIANPVFESFSVRRGLQTYSKIPARFHRNKFILSME
jgi:hypothetical protein